MLISFPGKKGEKNNGYDEKFPVTFLCQTGDSNDSNSFVSFTPFFLPPPRGATQPSFFV